MGSIKYSYTSKSEKEILINKSDEIKSLENAFYFFEKNINVWIIERPFLPKIKVVSDSGNFSVYSNGATAEEVMKAEQFIKGNMKSNFEKLDRKLNNVSYALFGVFNTNGFVYFDDIYLNENWFCYDDVIEILKSCGIKYMPVIYNGILNKSTTSIFKDYPSTFYKDKEIRSFIIRPVVEFEKKSDRAIAFVVNPKYKNKLPNFTKKTESVSDRSSTKRKTENKRSNEAASYLVDYYLDDQLFEYLREKLSENGIQINKNAKDKILSFVTKTFIDKFDSDINEISVAHSVDKTSIIESVKRTFPKKFLKKINI